MTSTRTYSDPKPQAKVREEIVRCSGTHFDPEVAGIMIAMIDDDPDYVMNERTASRDIWKGSRALWDVGRAKARENGHAVSQPDRLEKPETGERGDTAPGQEKSGRSRGTGLKREGGAEQSGGKRGVGMEPEKSGRGYESGSRKGSFVPQWIREIPELDVEEGITYCGSEGNYLSILDIFYDTAGKRADEIERAYEEGDILNYTVLVHALKRSARIIGAGALSELARELELAGTEGNTGVIRQNTGRLLEEYRELERKLAALK